MAENIIQLTVNTDTRRAVQATTLNTLKATDVIRLIAGERPIIAATFVNKDNTAIAFGGSDTFEMNVDVDFTHDQYAGTLNASYTGAVSSIAITFASDMTGLLRDTGSLTLKDSSNPSDRESVDYTAVVLSGGSNEIATFTVSKTLTNSYASGDYGAVQDKLMAQATEDDVNTGEWAAADKTAGKVSFRLDCRDVKFSEKLAAIGSALEYQIKMEIKTYPSGSTIPIVLMQDNVYGRQTVRDLEDVDIPSDENWTAADSRYLKKAGISGGQQAYGGTASGDDLTLNSTSNATKGSIILGSTSGAVFDEVNNRLSVGSTENTVTIGGTSYGSTLSAHAEGATDLAEFAVHRHSDTAGFGGHMVFARSRGTEAAETIVQSGDTVMRIDGLGHDGTDYEICAQIDMEIDGTPGAGDMPGRIVFLTTPDGSATPAEAMRINNAKQVLIGGISPVGSEKLYVNGSTHVANNVYIGGSTLSINWAESPILTIEGTAPLINLVDNTASSDDYNILNDNGIFRIFNDTDGRFDFNISGDGYVSIGTTTADARLHVEEDTALTNTVNYNQRLTHTTSGTPAAGIGLGIEFEQETSASNNEIIGTVEFVTTDVTGASEDADFVVKAMAGGAAAAEVMRVSSTGDLTIAGNLTRAHAFGYISSAAATSTITAATPRNIVENCTIAAQDVSAVDFTVDNTAKNVKYTGTPTKNFHVTSNISFISSASNIVVSLFIAKNGTVITGSEKTRKIGTGADVGNMSVDWAVSLATNDTITVYVDIDSGTATVTPNFGTVDISEV